MSNLIPTYPREKVIKFLEWLKGIYYLRLLNKENKTLLKDAIKYLTKDDKLVMGFNLNEKERIDTDNWLEEHKKECPHYLEKKIRTITYEFTPTGIGNGITIRCACGAFKDVTDVDCW